MIVDIALAAVAIVFEVVRQRYNNKYEKYKPTELDVRDAKAEGKVLPEGYTVNGEKIWVLALKETFFYKPIVSTMSKIYNTVSSYGNKVASFFGFGKDEEQEPLIEDIRVGEEASPLSKFLVDDLPEEVPASAKDTKSEDEVKITSEANKEKLHLEEEKAKEQEKKIEISDKKTILEEGEKVIDINNIEVVVNKNVAVEKDEGFEEDENIEVEVVVNKKVAVEKDEGFEDDAEFEDASTNTAKKKADEIPVSMTSCAVEAMNTDERNLLGEGNQTPVEVATT